MALTTAQKIQRLEDEWQTLQNRIDAMNEDSDYTNAGAVPNNSGPAGVDHGEYYRRWTQRQKEIEEQIERLGGGTTVYSEGFT